MPATNETLIRIVKELNEIRSALRRISGNIPLFDIDNENTPPVIFADQNNYVPGNYDALHLNTDAPRTITGITGGQKGRYLKLFNIGDYPITLAYESTSSTPANRFRFSNGTAAAIPPHGNLTVYYDAAQSRWVGGDIQSSGAIYMQVANTNSQNIPYHSTTKIDPGTVVSDQYGFYDDDNNQIVITMAGVYNISVFATWDVSTGPDTAFYFYLNNVLVSEMFDQFYPDGTVLHQTKMIWIKRFAQGDIIDLRAYNNSEAGGYALLTTYTTLIKIA